MDQPKHPLAKDTITDYEMDKWADWIKTHPRLTMGPITIEFEKKWSHWLGRNYSVFCNSGSSANFLMAAAVLASERLMNKKVVVPACGWPTTITPFIMLGFEPIMCDVDPDTWGLDIEHLKILLKEHNPGTVIFVQVLGVPNRMEPIMALRGEYGFILLEDSCAAMGSRYKGFKVGTFGDMASMSTYFGHQFSTVEGGIVSTDDEEFYELMLMIRSHGWDKQLSAEARQRIAKHYGYNLECDPFIFCELGLNVRPTDDHAYLGLSQLDKMDWLVERRYANHQLYEKLLGKDFDTQQYNDSIVCSIHFCALAESRHEQKLIYKTLKAQGIESRLFTAGNLGAHPFWFERYQNFTSPMADKLYNQGFFLPNNPSLNAEDIKSICSTVLRTAMKHRGESFV